MYSSVYIGLLYTTNETCVYIRCIVSWIECKYYFSTSLTAMSVGLQATSIVVSFW